MQNVVETGCLAEVKKNENHYKLMKTSVKADAVSERYSVTPVEVTSLKSAVENPQATLYVRALKQNKDTANKEINTITADT